MAELPCAGFLRRFSAGGGVILHRFFSFIWWMCVFFRHCFGGENVVFALPAHVTEVRRGAASFRSWRRRMLLHRRFGSKNMFFAVPLPRAWQRCGAWPHFFRRGWWKRALARLVSQAAGMRVLLRFFSVPFPPHARKRGCFHPSRPRLFLYAKSFSLCYNDSHIKSEGGIL